MENEQFDDMFAHIANQSGGIKPLLDAFFGFLNRKTDFYVEFDHTDNSEIGKKYTMGFPKGAATRMVQLAFQQYQMKDYNAVAATMGQNPAKIVTDLTTPDKREQKNVKSGKPSKCHAAEASTIPPKTLFPEEAPTVSNLSISSNIAVKYTDNGKQIPIGNGGVARNYYWTQTLKDLTVYVDISTGVRGKEIQCTVQPKSLKLIVRGETMMDGLLEDVVRTEESMWTLSTSSASDSKGPQVVITLDKTRHTWWKHVLVGDPEIDTNRVDSTQNISEYDDTTQATIRKIMFEQQQKRLGIQVQSPEEQKIQDVINSAAHQTGGPL